MESLATHNHVVLLCVVSTSLLYFWTYFWTMGTHYRGERVPNCVPISKVEAICIGFFFLRQDFVIWLWIAWYLLCTPKQSSKSWWSSCLCDLVYWSYRLQPLCPVLKALKTYILVYLFVTYFGEQGGTLPPGACGSQKTSCGSWFLPSTVWARGNGTYDLQAWQQVPLAPEPSCWPP